MFVHKIKIILSFLYVCQTFCWLTSLLIWGKFRDISGSGWYFYLIFLEIFLGCLYTKSKLFPISCMSVSLFVDLLPYWNYKNIGITQVLDDMSFWNLLETSTGCCYTNSEIFCISCVSVSLLVDLLPYWNYRNIGITPVLDEIQFWNSLETFLGCFYTSSK